MKKRILIRADGNLKIGYGHVIRSLALARILNSHYECFFLIQNPDSYLQAEIKKNVSGIIRLKEENNLIQEAKNLKLRKDDILILDGYRFNERYQKIVRDKVFKLVSIDDIYATHFYSDVVINFTYGVKASWYSIEKYTKLYLGTDYLLLRPPFFNSRNSLELKDEKRTFINLGGTDSKNYTIKALQKCLENPQLKCIDIVIGKLYPYRKELDKLVSGHPEKTITLHQNLSAEEMSNLMRKSDIGITSASTIAYEYCFAGGILFLYLTADNQKNVFSFLTKKKFGFKASQLNEVVDKMNQPDFVRDYFIDRKQFFKGDQSGNLSRIFEELELERDVTFRRATIMDCKQYFEWVNEPEVRRNSINNEPVSFDNHERWFKAKLNAPNAFLYIFFQGKIPLGQVRFDLTKKIAEIDYSISKDFRGKGYGKVLLKLAMLQLWREKPDVTIKGVVKVSNVASDRVFKVLGFKKKSVKVIDSETYNCYYKM